MGRADVLEHRWVIIADSGVLFWPGSHLSHPGNGWITYIKSWNCLHLPTPSLMWKNDSRAKDGSWVLLRWRYFISWIKSRFWQGNPWDKLWAMVLAPRWNVSRLVNNQPKKYKTSFDNLNFWKQFRGQVGSLWLPRKGKVFLLKCQSLVEMLIFFFQLYNMYTQTVLTYGKYLICRRALDKYFNMMFFTLVPCFIWLWTLYR